MKQRGTGWPDPRLYTGQGNLWTSTQGSTADSVTGLKIERPKWPGWELPGAVKDGSCSRICRAGPFPRTGTTCQSLSPIATTCSISPFPPTPCARRTS
eukprot:1283789-Pyramimonas_sp.AAC.1